MKFECNRHTLTEAVTNVQRAVSTKSSTPALEGILVKAENNKLQLYGYDLDICITTTIEASVREEGAAIITARLFSEIIRKLPEDNIKIEVDEKNIVYITSGRVDYKIIGMPASDYPEIPDIRSTDTVKIDGEALSSMIRQTIYAVSDKDIKPAHKGSLFEIEDGYIRIISVDGYRLAIRTEKIDYNGDKTFIVPGKSLLEVVKLITEDTKTIDIIVSGRHIIFKIGTYSVISRLIEGEFMNYKSSIPKLHSTKLKVNTRKFINTIERMSLLLTDKMKSPIRCLIDDGMIKTSCNTPLGNANDEIEAVIEGEGVEIGFNNRFLLDTLRYSETDEVNLALNGALSPMVVTPTEGDSFLFLLLPMRLTR